MTATLQSTDLFATYDVGPYWDEMFLGDGGQPRPHCQGLLAALAPWDSEEFDRRVARANATFQQLGITFTVYGDSRGTERLIPFDPIPRVIPSDEWGLIERGVVSACSRPQQLFAGHLSRAACAARRRGAGISCAGRSRLPPTNGRHRRA